MGGGKVSAIRTHLLFGAAPVEEGRCPWGASAVGDHADPSWMGRGIQAMGLDDDGYGYDDEDEDEDEDYDFDEYDPDDDEDLDEFDDDDEEY